MQSEDDLETEYNPTLSPGTENLDPALHTNYMLREYSSRDVCLWNEVLSHAVPFSWKPDTFKELYCSYSWMFYVFKFAGLGNARIHVNVNMFYILNEKFE
jgi:hypothetical protein